MEAGRDRGVRLKFVHNVQLEKEKLDHDMEYLTKEANSEVSLNAASGKPVVHVTDLHSDNKVLLILQFIPKRDSLKSSPCLSYNNVSII